MDRPKNREAHESACHVAESATTTGPAMRQVAVADLSYAAESLFDMLHLYSGYNVLSRGPIGCIHKALKVLHPEAQAMLACGAEVSEVRDRFWPTDENGDPIEPSAAPAKPPEPKMLGAVDALRAETVAALRKVNLNTTEPMAHLLSRVADELERGNK